jgi:spore germination cell wall hydrolase CwlJ-like protein
MDSRVSTHMLSGATRLGRRLVSRRSALIAAAGGGACLVIFGLATHRPSQGTSAGVTVALPPVSQSVAAIKALPPPNLLKAVSPEEAAKENAERPFAARPDTPASRFVLRTDAENRTRALTCLAQAVYYEAAGEGVDGGRAVAQVVLNRVRHPGFPSTVCGVVYEGSDRPTGCQFSFTCDGSMQRIPVPSLWARSKEIAEDALKGRVFGPVGHATHYHADYVLPYWADSLDKSEQIGRHIFYRLRGSIGDARGFSQRYGGAEPPFRVPGATVVMPQTAETEQLAKTLISGGAQGTTEEVAKASPVPSPPLLVDSAHAVLLADGNSSSAPNSKHRAQPSATCDTSVGSKQLSPIRADDMRASGGNSGC